MLFTSMVVCMTPALVRKEIYYLNIQFLRCNNVVNSNVDIYIYILRNSFVRNDNDLFIKLYCSHYRVLEIKKTTLGHKFIYI